MSFCIYLTHPQVQIDPEVPVPDWGLSDLGRKRAQQALDLPWASSIRHVVSSAERKAIETAEIFANRADLPVAVVENLHENDRSATGFLPSEEFERVADAFFADPETSIRGWERAIDAQARIVAGIRSVLTDLPDDMPVLFTGHGGVGTLLKCYLAGEPVDRRHDQKPGGGCWYRFEKTWLDSRSGTDLGWTAL